MDASYILGQIVGFIALAFCVGCYQIKNSRMLMLCKATGDCIYILHYLLIGAYSGCAAMVICALNGVLCSFRGQRWAEWKGWKWVLSAALVPACLASCRGMDDLFPGMCTLVSILFVIWSTWSGKARIIRLAKLFGAGPTWLVYSIIMRSYSGALSESIGMLSAAIGLYRYGFRKEDDEI